MGWWCTAIVGTMAVTRGVEGGRPIPGRGCPVFRLRRPRVLPDSATDTWLRALDRLDRAVVRYAEKVDGMRERSVRLELLFIGEELDAAAADLRAFGQERGTAAAGRDVALVNAVHRAATLAAHATEAGMTAHHAARRRQRDDVVDHLDAVRLLVKGIRELADSCRPHP